MKRFELSLLLAVIFCALVSFLSFEGECEQIRSSVLRLHILADSDAEDAQTLKLQVRDRILEVSEDIFAPCRTYNEARLAAQENLGIFEQTARQVLRENGCPDEVSVSLADSYFSTRTYGDITLPAGVYDALRIELGRAEGHNWWCVMFPTVCLPTAAGEAELGGTLTTGQVEIISGEGYELRFRCVEIYERFIEDLRQTREENT